MSTRLTRFVQNRSGIREVARSKELAVELVKDAEAIASHARAIAPVETGAYRGSIRVQESVESGQVVAHVVSDVAYASILEFGTSDTPTFAPLRRGAESAGFRLRA